MKTTVFIDFYSERCCEECNEIVHNHFDCPVCKKEYAGTSMYHEIDFAWSKEFSCENCNSEFNFTNGIITIDGYEVSFERH